MESAYPSSSEEAATRKPYRIKVRHAQSLHPAGKEERRASGTTEDILAEPYWYSPTPSTEKLYATLPTSPFPSHVGGSQRSNYYKNFLWKSDHWVLKGKPQSSVLHVLQGSWATSFRQPSPGPACWRTSQLFLHSHHAY